MRKRRGRYCGSTLCIILIGQYIVHRTQHTILIATWHHHEWLLHCYLCTMTISITTVTTAIRTNCPHQIQRRILIDGRNWRANQDKDEKWKRETWYHYKWLLHCHPYTKSSLPTWWTQTCQQIQQVCWYNPTYQSISIVYWYICTYIHVY